MYDDECVSLGFLDANLVISNAHFFKVVSRTSMRFCISKNSFLLQVVIGLLSLQEVFEKSPRGGVNR